MYLEYVPPRYSTFVESDKVMLGHRVLGILLLYGGTGFQSTVVQKWMALTRKCRAYLISNTGPLNAESPAEHFDDVARASL